MPPQHRCGKAETAFRGMRHFGLELAKFLGFALAAILCYYLFSWLEDTFGWWAVGMAVGIGLAALHCCVVMKAETSFRGMQRFGPELTKLVGLIVVGFLMVYIFKWIGDSFGGWAVAAAAGTLLAALFCIDRNMLAAKSQEKNTPA